MAGRVGGGVNYFLLLLSALPFTRCNWKDPPTFAAVDFTSSFDSLCHVTPRAGQTYDLSALVQATAVPDHHTPPWTYLVALCSSFGPSTDARLHGCGATSVGSDGVVRSGGAYLWQMETGAPCHRLTGPAPPAVGAIPDPTALGIMVAFEQAGDACPKPGADGAPGGFVNRSGQLVLECSNSAAHTARVEEVGLCTYRVTMQHAAGCPLGCPRAAAGGKVCGGSSRGACHADPATLQPRCRCRGGFTGRACEEAPPLPEAPSPEPSPPPPWRQQQQPQRQRPAPPALRERPSGADAGEGGRGSPACDSQPVALLPPLAYAAAAALFAYSAVRAGQAAGPAAKGSAGARAGGRMPPRALALLLAAGIAVLVFIFSAPAAPAPGAASVSASAASAAAAAAAFAAAAGAAAPGAAAAGGGGLFRLPGPAYGALPPAPFLASRLVLPAPLRASQRVYVQAANTGSDAAHALVQLAWTLHVALGVDKTFASAPAPGWDALYPARARLADEKDVAYAGLGALAVSEAFRGGGVAEGALGVKRFVWVLGDVEGAAREAGAHPGVKLLAGSFFAREVLRLPAAALLRPWVPPNEWPDAPAGVEDAAGAKEDLVLVDGDAAWDVDQVLEGAALGAVVERVPPDAPKHTLKALLTRAKVLVVTSPRGFERLAQVALLFFVVPIVVRFF